MQPFVGMFCVGKSSVRWRERQKKASVVYARIS